MANVSSITLRIQTSNRLLAGTNGRLYLGFGGREYRLNNPTLNDLERGDWNTFVLGVGATIANPVFNDPNSHLPIADSDIFNFPRYLRFEPQDSDDDWDIEGFEVFVQYVGGSNSVFTRPGLAGGNHLWLGERNSKIMYF